MSIKPHPFDPLSREEIYETTRIFLENHEFDPEEPSNAGKDWIFNSVVNKEPPKDILYPLLKSGGDLSGIPRKATLVVTEMQSGLSYELIVNLTEGEIDRFKKIPSDQQPILAPADFYAGERIAKADPTVVELCRQRGLPDMNLVVGEVWTYGYQGTIKYDKDYIGKRICHVFFYFRNDKNDNYYPHPLDFHVVHYIHLAGGAVNIRKAQVTLVETVENLKDMAVLMGKSFPLELTENWHTVVDLLAEAVIDLMYLPIKNDFSVSSNIPFPLPRPSENYIPRTPANNSAIYNGPEYYRKDVKPLDITQPDGPSFTVKGYEISWQNWNFHFSFNFRTGLNFHYITYQDGNKKREVLYRAGISETLTPYGDPRPPYPRKYALDAGEAGLGFGASTLSAGCDAINTSAKFFDVYINNSKGEPMTVKNIICVQEEDAGTLHKHTEYRTNKGYVVRSRCLNVFFVTSFSNYDYVFAWNFYQDGTIHHEVSATGILNTNLVAAGATTAGHGTLVFPQVNAQYHQHVFCVRLDPMIDGRNNTVAMYDVVADNSDYEFRRNPYSNGFHVNKTTFKRSMESVTDQNATTSRFWTVENRKKINKYTNTPVGWKITSTTFSNLLTNPTSFVNKRAGFGTHNMWVTQYRDDELYAGGTYINQSPGNGSLVKWVDRNDNIQDTDVVIWHVFGLTHVPRVEDFPLMAKESISVFFKPYNFFEATPALDVPAPAKCQTNLKKMSDSEGSKERCSKCYYGERRTPSSITCEHSKKYNGIVN